MKKKRLGAISAVCSPQSRRCCWTSARFCSAAWSDFFFAAASDVSGCCGQSLRCRTSRSYRGVPPRWHRDAAPRAHEAARASPPRTPPDFPRRAAGAKRSRSRGAGEPALPRSVHTPQSGVRFRLGPPLRGGKRQQSVAVSLMKVVLPCPYHRQNDRATLRCSSERSIGIKTWEDIRKIQRLARARLKTPAARDGEPKPAPRSPLLEPPEPIPYSSRVSFESLIRYWLTTSLAVARTATIMEMRLGLGRRQAATLRQCASALNLTSERVRQLQSQAEKRLRPRARCRTSPLFFPVDADS